MCEDMESVMRGLDCLATRLESQVGAVKGRSRSWNFILYTMGSCQRILYISDTYSGGCWPLKSRDRCPAGGGFIWAGSVCFRVWFSVFIDPKFSFRRTLSTDWAPGD